MVVDALRTGAPVGTVHRLHPADLAPPAGEFSLHELGVRSLLAALPLAVERPPEVVLIGAEAGEVHAFSEGLSAPLRSAVERAVRLVLRERATSR